MIGLRSQPPASTSRTLSVGSSLRRDATTQPAAPAPTTMWSNLVPMAVLRPSSDDSLLGQRCTVQQPLPTEPRQVDGRVAAGQEQFGHGPPAAGRVHQPVAGEAGQQVEVAEPARPRADDDVAVEVVLVVETRPRADAP